MQIRGTSGFIKPFSMARGIVGDDQVPGYHPGLSFGYLRPANQAGQGQNLYSSAFWLSPLD
jgi:hypothetical protein